MKVQRTIRPLIFVATLSMLGMVGCGARRTPNDSARGPYNDAQSAVDRGRLLEAGRLYDEATRLDPDALDPWLMSAQVHARLGQWEKSRVRAERALTLDGDDFTANVILGEAYLNQGNLTKAQTHFAKATNEDPHRIDGWLGQVRIAESSHDNAKAVSLLERAVAKNAKSVMLWKRLGELHWRLKNGEAAVGAFHQASLLLPDDKNLLGKTLRLAIDAEVMPTARAMIRAMSSTEIEAADVSMILAMMLSKSGKSQAAQSEVNRVLELESTNGNARMMAARLAMTEKRIDDALKHLQAIPAGSPRWLESLGLVGHLSMQSGKYQEAVRAFGQMRAAQPRFKEALLNLLQALLGAKELPRARSELLLAIARWPADAQLRFHQAIIIQGMDGDDAGVEAMKSVLVVEPEHAAALNFIGFTWADQGRHLKEAESMIRRALAREPRNGAMVDSLGWVMYQKGKLEEAETLLREALSLEPLHGEIYFHLAVVLKARKKIDEARKAFAEALKKTSSPEEQKKFKQVFGEEVL